MHLMPITIFLALSEQLEDERIKFKSFISEESTHNIHIDVITGKDTSDAVSKTRSQDEYNKYIRDCDIFVALFFTKAGKYTVEEFYVAYQNFKEFGRPKIFTYFKRADNQDKDNNDDGKSLIKFRNKLEDLGHHWTAYGNTEELHLKFKKELDSYRNERKSTKVFNEVKKPKSTVLEDNSLFITNHPVKYAHFFGRKGIVERLFNAWKSLPIQNVAIYGEKQIGTTSLLFYLKDVVDNPNDSRFREEQKINWLPNPEYYCFIYVDFQDVECQNQKRLLEYILQKMKLEDADTLDLSLSEDNPLLGFRRIVAEHLVRPTLILMDKIDILLEYHSEEFSNNFWEGLRSIVTTILEMRCLGFVLASHKLPTELDNLSSGSSSFISIFSHTIKLKAFSEQEARELIYSSPEPFSDDDVEFILKQSERKPHLLQKLCQRCLEAKDNNWQSEAIQEIEQMKKIG